MTHRYNFDRQYGELFRRNGIDLGELLRRSSLPEDLFSRRDILLTQAEYFGLLEQLGQLAKDDETVIRIATAESIETLIPPVFAAYCSSDSLSFLKRFATYKRLIGPMKITVTEKDDKVEVELLADDNEARLPAFFAELEMLFTLTVVRKATLSEIIPLSVNSQHEITNENIKTYFGCPIIQSDRNLLTFALMDMQRPFTSRNDAMWSYFEPELSRRLSEMELDDSIAARVRSILVELLPAGKSSIVDVAAKLFLSRRTLQRKLADEKTTYQQQLNSTRLLLAQNYIKNCERTSEEIAFLLGYEDTTSFLRAFNVWTGMTATEYKRQQR